MLGGYFAWSDSAGFNKVFKLVSRLLMTISIYYVFRMIVKRGAIPSFSFANVLSPVLYAVYLGLGLLSFYGAPMFLIRHYNGLWTLKASLLLTISLVLSYCSKSISPIPK